MQTRALVFAFGQRRNNPETNPLIEVTYCAEVCGISTCGNVLKYAHPQ